MKKSIKPLISGLIAANAYADTGNSGNIAGDADGDGADYSRGGVLNLFDALSTLRYIAV